MKISFPVVLCCVGAVIGVGSVATFDNARREFWAPDLQAAAGEDAKRTVLSDPDIEFFDRVKARILAGENVSNEDLNHAVELKRRYLDPLKMAEARIRVGTAWRSRVYLLAWSFAAASAACFGAGVPLLLTASRRSAPASCA